MTLASIIDDTFLEQCRNIINFKVSLDINDFVWKLKKKNLDKKMKKVFLVEYWI